LRAASWLVAAARSDTVRHVRYFLAVILNNRRPANSCLLPFSIRRCIADDRPDDSPPTDVILVKLDPAK